MILILATLFLIVFKAVIDGLALRGYNKTILGVIEALYLAVVYTGFIIGVMSAAIFPINYTPVLKVIAGFLLIRFALFDAILNKVAGLDFFFIGSTKLFDKAWNKFFDWTHFPPNLFLPMAKTMCLMTGIAFLLDL